MLYRLFTKLLISVLCVSGIGKSKAIQIYVFLGAFRSFFMGTVVGAGALSSTGGRSIESIHIASAFSSSCRLLRFLLCWPWGSGDLMMGGENMKDFSGVKGFIVSSV